MKRKELNFVLDSNGYIPGGTKESCVKIKEFLRNSTHFNAYTISSSCVSIQEFLESVQVLLAFAFQQEDTIPKTWHCDSDCHRAMDLLCPGECCLDKDSESLCPYFQDESLI